MKILIVDDSEDAIRLARHRLAPEQVSVLVAADGSAGLEAARAEKPDLILLDVDMPGMSGFEVCQVLKSDPELSLIPVVFLSGSGGPEDKVRGLDLGAVDYVTKPFDAFELRARVRAALRTKHLQDLLTEQAQIDPLTGLANRRSLERSLGREWARVERHGSPLSFIMLDLDHFKQVNDTFGHAVGDRVLQGVSGVLAEESRDTDSPARYGGEEFAILVPGDSVDGAVLLAERCRAGIESLRTNHQGQDISASASFGVADAAAKSSWAELVAAADEALYQAKAAGRNRVKVHGAT